MNRVAGQIEKIREDHDACSTGRSREFGPKPYKKTSARFDRKPDEAGFGGQANDPRLQEAVKERNVCVCRRTIRVDLTSMTIPKTGMTC